VLIRTHAITSLGDADESQVHVPVAVAVVTVLIVASVNPSCVGETVKWVVIGRLIDYMETFCSFVIDEKYEKSLILQKSV
jgi:hypothetical protein